MSNNLNESPQEPGHEPETPFLLDGAAPQNVPLPTELQAEVRIASNRDSALEERLEAYENIFDSEIGDTKLTRARNIERETGLRQLYLKFDGGNPTGHPEGPHRLRPGPGRAAPRLRHHDRCHLRQLRRRRGLAASYAGLRCLVFIPSTYHPTRVEEMQVATAPRSCSIRETTRRRSRPRRERAEREELYDANPGGANTALQLRAYGEIAYEIYDELRDAPAAVAVPVSNGTTLAGIHRGFVSLYRRGKTSRIPRMVAGSSVGKNPIVHSFLKGLPHCVDLAPSTIRETAGQRAAHQLALARRRPRAGGDPVVQRVGVVGQRPRHAAVRAQGAGGRGSERPARIHRGSDRASRRTRPRPAAPRPIRRRHDREESMSSDHGPGRQRHRLL